MKTSDSVVSAIGGVAAGYLLWLPPFSIAMRTRRWANGPPLGSSQVRW
jgi:hypothetical protein